MTVTDIYRNLFFCPTDDSNYLYTQSLKSNPFKRHNKVEAIRCDLAMNIEKLQLICMLYCVAEHFSVTASRHLPTCIGTHLPSNKGWRAEGHQVMWYSMDSPNTNPA